MKKKDRIYINKWLQFHPYEKPVNSDMFYLRLCNEVWAVCRSLEKIGDNIAGPEETQELACTLVCWFEDVVSETGLWKAFVERNKELHGKYLPFYDLEVYYPNEINPQDISFLMWYYLTKRMEDFEFDPMAKIFELLSEYIYEILDGVWDQAPVNTKLTTFLQVPEDEKDYFPVRKKVDWLFMRSYLFFYHGEDAALKEVLTIDDLKEEGLLNIDESIISRDFHDKEVLNGISSLHAERSHQWLARILGREHPLYEPLMEVEDRIKSKFFYEGHNSKVIHLKHIATGYKLDVTRKSLVLPADILSQRVVYAGLIKWMNEWWISGDYFFEEMTEEILKMEASDPVESNHFANMEDILSTTRLTYRHFLDFNNNKPVAFLKNGHELQAFSSAFIQYHYREISKEKPEDLPPSEDEFGELGSDEGFIVFFNPEYGMEIMYDYNALFDDPGNELFDPDDEELKPIDLIYDNEVSPAFIRYALENYGIEGFYFPNNEDERIVMDNLDFLLRFYKPEIYHRKPLIVSV